MRQRAGGDDHGDVDSYPVQQPSSKKTVGDLFLYVLSMIMMAAWILSGLPALQHVHA